MSQPPPEIQLMRLANAFQLSRAVQVAARLGLGRRLAEGPRSAAELARATGTREGVLRRLLRFLAELGVVAERDDGQFGPTALSERLHLVDNLVQGEEGWAAWGALPEALRTGDCVFESVHGAPFYAYAAAHPEQEANWVEWNTTVGGVWFPAIAEALALAGTETVVDVGGGEGLMLAAILLRHSECRGVLLDLPGVVEKAPALLAEAGAGDRCEIVGGDAFEEVPPGGDVYLLNRVLHNWDDEHAARLLTRCQEAMGPASRLVAIEALMPEPGNPRRRLLAAHDLNLLLLWGGGHRTRSEMAALFARAGLEMVGVAEVASTTGELPWQCVEARRRPDQRMG